VKPAPVVADSTATAPQDSTLAAKDTTVTQQPVDTVVKPTPAPKPTGGYITYVIKKGDTLSSIGRKYGKTATEIAKYNHITNVNAIREGQKIKIPR